jgi:hypothetical protein
MVPGCETSRVTSGLSIDEGFGLKVGGLGIGDGAGLPCVGDCSGAGGKVGNTATVPDDEDVGSPCGGGGAAGLEAAGGLRKGKGSGIRSGFDISGSEVGTGAEDGIRLGFDTSGGGELTAGTEREGE